MKPISDYNLSHQIKAMQHMASQHTEEPEELNTQVYWRKKILETHESERFDVLKSLWWQITKYVCPNYRVAESEMTLTATLVNQAVSRWMPQEYTAGGLNPQKGVILMGDVGVGKTTLLQSITLFNTYCNNILRLQDYSYLRSIPESKYLVNCIAEVMKHQFREQEPPLALLNEDMLIDDLGKEPKKVRRYGNDINLFEYILFERYATYKRRESKQLKPLITNITTNSTLDELNAFYGSFIVDRIMEMCEVVEWKGQSKR